MDCKMATHGKNNGVFTTAPAGGRIGVDPPTKGAMNEYTAMSWLMSQGYDVFRNASPVGRADIVAKNWDTDELLWIDVKSQEYNPDCKDGYNEIALKQHHQARKYKTSDIKYLVVNDDGSCQWYGENKIVPLPDDRKYWSDPKSGQHFLHPIFDMKVSEWKTFCFWMLEYYTQDLTHEQVETLRGCAQAIKYKRGRDVLQLVRAVLYRKITGNDVIPAADNDNNKVIGDMDGMVNEAS
jgi:Holliday junction resolvase-like predicted endonuclease